MVPNTLRAAWSSKCRPAWLILLVSTQFHSMFRTRTALTVAPSLMICSRHGCRDFTSRRLRWRFFIVCILFDSSVIRDLLGINPDEPGYSTLAYFYCGSAASRLQGVRPTMKITTSRRRQRLFVVADGMRAGRGKRQQYGGRLFSRRSPSSAMHRPPPAGMIQANEAIVEAGGGSRAGMGTTAWRDTAPKTH